MSKILFIDSGIGGLTTLSETVKLLNANYIYYADNKFAPYGTKDDAFLKSRLEEIIKTHLLNNDISMVVLACNTATTTSISYLRQTFKNLTIIGTEPAIKLATDQNFQSPAIIATPQTISHLKKNVTKNCLLIPHKNLASLIENAFLKPSPKTNFELTKEIFSLKTSLKSRDCIVLGCTHYPFIKQKLQKILSQTVLDGNKGVANRIFSLQSNQNQQQQRISTVKIELSSYKNDALQKYKKILKQTLAKQINLC